MCNAQEERAAYNARKMFGAERRAERRFTLSDSQGTTSTMIWDDAGHRSDGSVVLVEVECGPIVSLHIEGHLSRLAFLASVNIPITHLVWVVRQRNFQILKRIVDVWLFRFGQIAEVAMPRIGYVSLDGVLLDASS